MIQYPYINRDLSWIEFNRRVLFQARDKRNPILDRVRFLTIFSSNLDEFFMKRIGYIRQKSESGATTIGHDMAYPPHLFQEIRKRVQALIHERAHCYESEILPRLQEQGVLLLKWNELTPEQKIYANTFFRKNVFPVLTPLAVDPSHPFPFLSNLSVSLGIMLRHPITKVRSFARIKIPNTLPQWVEIGERNVNDPYQFVRLQDVIRHHLQELFPEVEIENVMAFRVTRNADIEYTEEAVDDILDVIEEELRLRHTAELVRLEIEASADPNILHFLTTELELNEESVFENQGELNFRTLDEIANLNLPHLKFRSWIPVTPYPFDKHQSIFEKIAQEDILLHHPYESFSGSIERLVREAVKDPNVLAIKMTLYRTEKESALIPLLTKAAYSGKQVVCIVEPKARFDEAQNIQWGEMLERAGVHVVYGMMGFKIHAKLTLIVRKEHSDYRFYCHLGTGNYNSDTAKLYTDLGLLTSDRTITAEVIQLFNYLTGLSMNRNYKSLLVSPLNMKQHFLNYIEQEIQFAKAGQPAQIIAKMNSLEDQQLCDALYRAAAAGVSIDLIVRGICCVQPGIPKLSENIRIRSVVGQFLEHSRIYYFRSGKLNPVQGNFFINSADWMFRNMHSRVEVSVPIQSESLKQECWDILALYLQDEYQSWELKEKGQYELKAPILDDPATAVQMQLMNYAREKFITRRSLYGTQAAGHSSRNSRKKRDLRTVWKSRYLTATDDERPKKNETKRRGPIKDHPTR